MYDWCRNPDTTKFLPFDFVIEALKVIIELDGPQHFKQVRNWMNPSKAYLRDRYKEYVAKQNGYTVIRILQEDAWEDRIEWKPLLLDAIQLSYPTPSAVQLYNNIIEIVSYELHFIETVVE